MNIHIRAIDKFYSFAVESHYIGTDHRDHLLVWQRHQPHDIKVAEFTPPWAWRLAEAQTDREAGRAEVAI